MASAEAHYATLLAPIYSWMAGGIEAACAQGAADVAFLCPAPSTHALAVDLGAGFGMHAVPLAKAGYDVVAIDQSEVLLGELRSICDGLAVRTVQADLLAFQAVLTAPPALVLCMGDTLTHVEDAAQVERLFADVGRSLAARGRFVATFRDYSALPAGDARFIHVRSDPRRIHTCFLEERSQHVAVTDVLHERVGETWQMRVSSYLKLRLSPEWVMQALARAGLAGHLDRGPRGMVQITAMRAGELC
jgi:SAM-dependent methyltransferase